MMAVFLSGKGALILKSGYMVATWRIHKEKAPNAKCAKCLILLVGPEGLEPPTKGL